MGVGAVVEASRPESSHPFAQHVTVSTESRLKTRLAAVARTEFSVAPKPFSVTPEPFSVALILLRYKFSVF